MKIYLYLSGMIADFNLPTMVSGSFSFDIDDEENKLINIESRNNKWVLYSTDEVSVIVSGNKVDQLELLPNRYYIVRRKNINYLVYVTDVFDNTFLTYTYSNQLNLIIGNDPNCNICFKNSLIKGVACTVTLENGNMILTTFNTPIYVNNKAIKENKTKIKIGDSINIYGLKVILNGNLLLINNPLSAVSINPTTSNIQRYNVPTQEKPTDIDIKDVDLYTKDDYYSKSPRIRRLIETKEIEFSQPPKPEGEQEMPLLLTIGPTITMAVVAVIRFVNSLTKVMNGTGTFQSEFLQIMSSAAMLLTSILWPTLTKKFNKKLKEKKNRELMEKYTRYLNGKRTELSNEELKQREILNENFISVEKCLEFIDQGKINFWDKRIEQNDFLEVYLGDGDVPLDVEINFPEEGFTVDEDNLKKQAEALVKEYEYIKNVPVSYSFYENKITALMGNPTQMYGIMNNILLQLMTFYTYEDLKIVVFTNEINKGKWSYLKYLNHSFSNDKNVRFFSTNSETAKALSDYLCFEIQTRAENAQENGFSGKPYYLIITDDYYQIKRLGITKALTEIDVNLGFSLVIMEQKMNKLPSKCSNFINMSKGASGILLNSFEDQKQITFHDRINYDIDMMQVVKKLSNIPIEFEENTGGLPESLTFLEMEKVGKVEQLNVLNRWNTNDSTQTLKAEIGVDEIGNLMYLDLHEKYHGPHGLIAGMTGSGKSEFIITYILSMAINYSPDDIAFILIDYKGGGLAGAFENKVTGVTLPHLAGTITNLDKAEMDRTLVSIDSEVKRRQKIFNDARDKLGESTIDIYKYQRFYKEGKLDEPCPHLFIICDEFAELKSQQPGFMDNLISVARIGRSLGVHLILATQKPTGVVNDQIWSNTKFRVCLKVQDAGDSKEMLKRPEAASIKQAGRFYLQVGYDEYFALGQSGWCGAKYYPSETIVKNVDKSINFIDDIGNFIKSIQAGKNTKIEAQGEQLAAIMKVIIEVSEMTGKKARRLWLNNIDPIILVDDLEKKYNVTKKDYDVTAIIGEYDAPEKQEQGLLTYSLREQGNTIIYGNDEVEREKLVTSILYSTCKNYLSNEFNAYVVDYGSETLRMFESFPQVGGMVFLGEDERIRNLFKLIKEEIQKRKKILVDYGGSLDIYNEKNTVKLPQIMFVLNNYESIIDSYPDISEEVIKMARDSERYGISIIIVCANVSSIGRRLAQSFNNRYVLHFTDSDDYYSVFSKKANAPRNILGRGLVNNNGIHEYQTASIVGDEENPIEYVTTVCEKVKSIDTNKAPSIPALPEKVTLDLVEKYITTLSEVPVGINKQSLKIEKFNFLEYPMTNILANKLNNINCFMDSLMDVLIRINDLNIFFIDTTQLLPSVKEKNFNGKVVNYYDGNFEEVFDKILEIQKDANNANAKMLYIIYGIDKLRNKLDTKKLDELFTENKANDNCTVLCCDSAKGIKAIEMEAWYSKVRNNTDGLWVGSGMGDQQAFRLTRVAKELNAKYNNNFGFYISEGDARLIKCIEFNDMLGEGDQDEE